MTSLLIIRLHPEEPVHDNDFTDYLEGLEITVHDVTFSGTDRLLGDAKYLPPRFDETRSVDQDKLHPRHKPDNNIAQHYSIVEHRPATQNSLAIYKLSMFSVATAVIEFDDSAAGSEYETVDVYLEIKRNGDEIVHRQTYYNVLIGSDPIPGDPNNFRSISDSNGEPIISLHLALPSSGQQLNQIVTVPEDGSAPNFEKLRKEVEDVLNAEPGNLDKITELTRDECRHIAYEIIWDRMSYPLPVPKRSLEDLYTLSDSEEEERDRNIFESDLLVYYVKHNHEAERLANFVFSLSSAIWCEGKCSEATHAGFFFPVFYDSSSRETKVILKGVETGGIVSVLDPVFKVPAAYFYALTAILPPQIDREQRFSLATLDAETQTISSILRSFDDHVLDEEDSDLISPAGVNHIQAARRLRALGLAGEKGKPECEVIPTEDIHELVGNWLNYEDPDLKNPDINIFWKGLVGRLITGHLDLVLCAITNAHKPLVDAIKGLDFNVTNDVTELDAKTRGEWETLLQPEPPNPALLPDFTKPGTTEERTQAFIRHVRKFFEVVNVVDLPNVSTVDGAPGLDRTPGNLLDEFLVAYNDISGLDFSFASWISDQNFLDSLESIFPGDDEAKGKLIAWLVCLKNVISLTKGIEPDELQFSIMEALWSRGVTNSENIQGFSLDDFREVLIGSVAYEYAEEIWNNSGVAEPDVKASPEEFRPVNPDGSLVNCVPPKHLSPLGSVAYLHDLLLVSQESTCENPLPEDVNETLGSVLISRRGALGDLLATQANLEVPIPLIDIVNESLEHMIVNSGSSGAVYNTSSDQVSGHELTSNPSPSPDVHLHEPEILLEAIPEHSTPATPTAQQDAYNKLESDFSVCDLPYSQPLDVSRTYLNQLGTTRFATMRRFRKEITEFVLEPAKETSEFQKHLWRYPVRIDIAIEYLGITSEEYSTLLQNDISNALNPPADKLSLYNLFSFPKKVDEDGKDWTEIVVRLSEFLERTCLTYCEFLDLWQSEFVKIGLKGNQEGFPECEPCCLDEHLIEFVAPSNPVQALKRLAIFIRLWRKLQAVQNAKYTFTELRDICDVLELFNGANINPDFIRQLAAFQMFRDDFELSLTDGTSPVAGEIGAERLHLLAFWSVGSPKRNWAIDHLLDQIQQYAMKTLGSKCREPEFIKLLMVNLNPLSLLAGFDPNNLADSWQAHPTHTLRFAEILAKMYASEFHVGELLFLFTNEAHLQGDDPFHLQTVNEANDSPLGLPDDEDSYSLSVLRNKLLDVEVTEDATKEWTWARMGKVLKEEFGFIPAPGNDRWLMFGQHFFPAVLSDSGIVVSALQKQYRISLLTTSELMWNTPLDGPFQYDSTAQELWTQVPITDEAVIAKLGRIRQLSNPEEQDAIRDLYFLPRVDLAAFSLIFSNLGEAEEQLIQEPDEAVRWAWFQQEFDSFYQRCQIIVEHLAAHVDNATNSSNSEGEQLARLLLKSLWADENMATTSWEDDSGQSPSATWVPQPNGGAFAALLGLAGTGMVAEYLDSNKAIRWREIRGGVDAFGPEENSWNSPIPTIVPSMNFTLTPDQLRFAAVRNGFAMANFDGAMLGGVEPFLLRWKGLLLVDNKGQYGFAAGAPTPMGELPDFDSTDQSHRWRVILNQGQKTWVLLSHDWPDEEAPADCSKPIMLNQGFYELSIELERKPLSFDGPEDVCPQTTGFQLKYKGPDSGADWLAIPHNKLFQEQKEGMLKSDLDSSDIKSSKAAQDFLEVHYTSSVRDIRRTYQRAFKAMLLVSRLRISAEPVSDDRQSELSYVLSRPVNFAGQAYYRNGGAFVTHKANFDPNLLPVFDNYQPPSFLQDQRVNPSVQRRQALFDWWERLFDYIEMRTETQRSPEQPAWLLFHEAYETHVDQPAHLLRHIGIDMRHSNIVLRHYDAIEMDLSYDVTSADLEDDRWALRVWKSEKWIRALLQVFYTKNISSANVFLWASDGPVMEGNNNLTQFYQNGCIENKEPHRYEEVKLLNDGLRQRGRAALVAYLTHLNRVVLPWGGFAAEVKHLSELLLLDVETGLCQKSSRVEEAISAAQLFVQRVRLGLEPAIIVPPGFVLSWERHFATFRTWEACKRRNIYRENWVEWEELHKAKQTEAFQFFESELRSSSLTMPVPGGLTDWNGSRPPQHPGITLLQNHEQSNMELIKPAIDGLGLMGTPELHARPSWLAPLKSSPDLSTNDPDSDTDDHSDEDNNVILLLVAGTNLNGFSDLPMWLQAPVRLGTKFIRVSAAGIPPSNTTFESKCDSVDSIVCCDICGDTHPALMDEYYFWIEKSEHYNGKEQVAEWGAMADDPQTDWHRPDKLPGLLHWNSEPMVHLRWCRLHNGEFQQPRQSDEGVYVIQNETPELSFLGRSGDSLHFKVTFGVIPKGYSSPPDPGFRYDITTDEAITLPEVVVVTKPVPTFGGLVAFPFFAWFDPGSPLIPTSMFSPVLSAAGHLRSHCRFEEALKWYESEYHPLLNDNSWVDCSTSAGEYREPLILTHVPSESTIITHSKTCCCASDPVTENEAKERAVLLHYLEALMEWGNSLMRINTPEAFQHARLIFDTTANILGTTPLTVFSNEESPESLTITDFESDCAPINPRLMCLYTNINDRLSMIHACLNSKRLKNGRPNLDMPYFGNNDLQDCWKNTIDVCDAENSWCLPHSPYRFIVLVQKAQEIASEVRSLGSSLLAAFEKGDAEYLSTMRTMHERQLLNLGLDVRKNQWRDADWQIQALEKTKEISLARLQYFKSLISNGLIGKETAYQADMSVSLAGHTAGQISEGVAQSISSVPDIWVGTVGFFPTMLQQLPIGSKLGGVFATAARISNSVASSASTLASQHLTEAGWERRKQEWEHQVDVLTIEVEQIERQILAAERRRDIAQRELNNHQQQIENAVETNDFLRDKFTNHALYLWMQQETTAIYYQMYELALQCAFQAQRAFNYERGYTTRKFIPTEIWEDLHEGLLSGERLQLATGQMDKAYYNENVREYELTKHVSLRMHFPMAFLQLKVTGYCEIEIPEWMFDLDYPGHYMRRIKNVTMTIPCIVGPYTGVHCRLIQLSSKTRVDPRLLNSPHNCCDDEEWKNGYQTMPDDSRIVSMYTATEGIATSSGQNDSGMFELNFRDERYLPFEFTGAVSRWRIELPLENNQFDMESLSDVVLHLNFSAREGGENLRKVANECAQQNLPGEGMRLFDVKHELTEAWHLFKSTDLGDNKSKHLGIQLSRNMFPFLTGNKKIAVHKLEILFEVSGADPSKHHIVEFLVGQRAGTIIEDKCDIEIHSISCVADAKWPGYFHGVLEIKPKELNASDIQDLGVFQFPLDVGGISSVYLFCEYSFTK